MENLLLTISLMASNNERNDQQYVDAEDFINYNRQGIAWYREAANLPNQFGAF
ncbi:MAG: hypothetical protein R3C61_07145 [Bacteroidia bacterium]